MPMCRKKTVGRYKHLMRPLLSMEVAAELWKKDRDAQMNQPNIQETEKIISARKGKLIMLFNSTILQGDCHLVEEFFNFERRIYNDESQRSSSEEFLEIETDSMN